jgi:hypothetical protein
VRGVVCDGYDASWSGYLVVTCVLVYLGDNGMGMVVLLVRWYGDRGMWYGDEVQ